MIARLEVVLAVARRSWLKVVRRPVVLTFSLAQPLIWMGFFGFLFERYRLADLDPGIAYLDFLAPGVCAMTVLFGASQAGVSWIRDLQTGFLPRLLDTPAGHHPILAGKLLADVLRLLLQGAVVLALALLLGAGLTPLTPTLVPALLALALLGAALSALSSAVALRARAPEVMATYVHLVNMPLLFTSTALVPGRQMPPWLEAISRYNPLTLAVDALRGALLLGEAASLTAQLLPLAALAIVCYLLAARELKAAAGLY